MATTYISRRVSDPLLALLDTALQVVAEQIATRLGLNVSYKDLDGDGEITLVIDGSSAELGQFLSDLYGKAGVAGLVVDVTAKEDPAPIEESFSSFYPGEIVVV